MLYYKNPIGVQFVVVQKFGSVLSSKIKILQHVDINETVLYKEHSLRILIIFKCN